jgi:uncharacterized protein (TIGR02145 family)
MKETGIAHWLSPNFGATNESGFSALPGGSRDRTFGYLGYHGFWWSSTEYSTKYAWSFVLGYNFSTINQFMNFQEFGFSVRCVRDN